MSDLNTSKVDGNTVAAEEWNQFAEIDNLITTSGQTPSTGDLNQSGIAAARYSSGGQFYTDSGTANAYVLAPVSQFQSPVNATNNYFNGMIIRFRAGNANTGASTVIVNGATSKSLLKEDGSPLTAGDIQLYSDVAFRYNGTNFVRFQGNATITSRGQAFLANPITIANNTTTPNTDIDFSGGVFQFSDGTGQAVASALTKRLQSSGSWSAGAAGNMLLTGARANSSDYHLFAIFNPTTGISDYGALLGVAATTPDPTASLPSGYTKFLYIGTIHTDSSGNILPFKQTGRQFVFATVINSINGASQTTGSETLRTIRTPLGIKTKARGSLIGVASSAGSAHLKAYDADITSSTIASNDGGVYISNGVANGVGYFEAITNTSSQIKTNLVNTSGTPSITCSITISGYENLNLTQF